MNKKSILFIAISLLITYQMSGCGSDQSTNTSNIVGDAVDTNCSANSTGELLYGNTGNAPMKVIIDGFDYGIITPGQTLRANLTAGFQSTVRSEWQDGSTACSTSTVPIIACQTQSVVCGATR